MPSTAISTEPRERVVACAGVGYQVRERDVDGSMTLARKRAALGETIVLEPAEEMRLDEGGLLAKPGATRADVEQAAAQRIEAYRAARSQMPEGL